MRVFREYTSNDFGRSSFCGLQLLLADGVRYKGIWCGY